MQFLAYDITLFLHLILFPEELIGRSEDKFINNNTYSYCDNDRHNITYTDMDSDKQQPGYTTWPALVQSRYKGNNDAGYTYYTQTVLTDHRALNKCPYDPIKTWTKGCHDREDKEH